MPIFHFPQELNLHRIHPQAPWDVPALPDSRGGGEAWARRVGVMPWPLGGGEGTKHKGKEKAE